MVYAAAGIEVPAGGEFVGAHTPPLLGQSRAQTSAPKPVSSMTSWSPIII
ncbi:hypothetical protein Pd630_LPD16068 (plasmid) [Rhodococcus opacus PD630]|nr:hypothetical protein Pd630_LPD16068 [Rhodococcus opacus PD630]